MAVKIQIKRGSKAGLPALAPGEYGLATDTAELFVGGSSGNLQIPVLDSTGKVPSSQLPEMDYDPAGSAEAVQASLTAHVNDEDNPHGVTAEQVGAVPVTGGTLQGDLIIDQVSTTSHHTVDFQWREDTMSSFQFPVLRGLQLPSEADEAANKLYVDDAIDEATAGSIKLSEIEVLLPAGGYWRSIIYGNGKFVVVGYNSNRAAYSTDGITWTETVLPSSASWEAVTYGDGKFVAVADNRAAYSEDGIDWTAATLPSNEDWSAVTYGNGKFVAVSYGAFVYSEDGIDWTETTTPTGTAYSSVTYGGGKFVAVGSTFTATGGAAYSSDGIRWTAAKMPNMGTWSAVTYGNGKFVAMSNSRAAYSTDGITWTAAMMPSSASWEAVTYSDGKFVTVAHSTNKAAYSTDGINWTAATLPSSEAWGSVAYGNGKFVAAAENITGKVAYSYDGITWINTTQALTDSAGDDITDDVAQALGVSKIVTGSYVGTGTSGKQNPNTLTFSDTFIPKIVFIMSSNASYLASPYCWGADAMGIYHISSNSSAYFNLVTVSGNVMSWYFNNFSNSSDYQLNAQGKTYNYIAIG